MTDHEEPQLRAALDQAANTLAVPADWDDLVRRRVRRERRGRRTAIALVLVAALLAGGAGYELGTDDGEPARVTAREGARARDGLRAVTTTPAPLLPSGSPSSGAVLVPQLGERAVAASAVGVLTASSEPLGRAFVRTHDGMTVRVYRGKVSPPDQQVPWFHPPGWCFASGIVYVGASSDLAVGTAYGNTFDELRDGQIVATVAVVGLVEDDPGRVVVAQVPERTSRVEAQFPDGATDTMAPIDHVAVLVAKAPDARTEARRSAPVTVRALATDGSVLSSVDVQPRLAVLDFGISSGTSDPACRADMQLPPPGQEQPANVDAARAAVVDVVRRFSDGSVPAETRAGLLDDSRGFLDIQSEIAQTYGQEVTDARAGQTIDVVFTSATRAAVRFSVVTGVSTYPFFGEVVLTDAGWRLTRDTWCHEITLAGKQCP